MKGHGNFLGWRRIGASIVLSWIVVLAEAAWGQPPRGNPGPVESQTDADYARCLKLLEGVHDNVYSFDDPAFYCFRNYVRDDPRSDRYDVRETDVLVPWQFLLERPSDYRGRLVALEGRLLKRHPPYELTNRRGGGAWYQCELGHPDTRAACTVVLIEDPGAIPLQATVRVKGFFIKVRGYQAKSGKTAAGPLLVGRRLESVSGTGGASGGRLEPIGEGRYTWLIAGTAALALVWLVLRRGLRAAPPRFTARGPRREKESPEDFDWMIKQDSDE